MLLEFTSAKRLFPVLFQITALFLCCSTVSAYAAETTPESDSTWVVGADGHLKCIIKPTINCIDHTITLGAMLESFTSGQTPIIVNWNTGENAQKIVVSAGGTYSYDDSGFGCDHHLNTITVPDFFGGPLEISGPTVKCVGDQIEITVNTEGYNFQSFDWNPDNDDITPYIIENPGTYSLTVTDQNGCTYTDSHTVFQSPPVVPIMAGPIIMCPTGDSSIVVANGGPFTTYNWSTGVTGINVITVYEPGIYNVTVTNALGCTGEGTWGIESGEAYGATIGATYQAICPGIPDTLTALGNFPFFSWSTGQTTRKIVVTQPGTYSVTVTTLAGCSTSTQIVVQPIPNPAPAIQVPIMCPGQTVTLTTTGGAFAQYHWAGGQTGDTIHINTPGQYSVTVSNSLGCTGSATVSVAQAPTPSIDISGPTVACPGQTPTLSATPGFVQYTWSTGDTIPNVVVNMTGVYTVAVVDTNGCAGSATHSLNISSAPVPQISVAPYACNNQLTLSADPGFLAYTWSDGSTAPTINVTAGGTYTVTVSAGVGCTGSSSQSVMIPLNPTVSISGVSQFCNGLSSTLQATGGLAQYQWSGGQTTNNITVSQSGTYTVTVTDLNSCTATDSFNVTALALPQPAITGPASICAGFSASLSVNGSFSQYQWSTGATTPAIAPTQAGTYTVTVTDGNGCTGTTTHAFTVNNSLVTQLAVAPYACDNQLIVSADPGFTGYNWSNGSTSQSTTALANGAYTVTVTDASGCTGTASQLVAIPQNPATSIVGPTQICPGGTASLNVNGSFSSYQWSTGANNAGIATTASGDFTVTVTDALGCTATAVHTVAFGTSLSISIAVSPYACNNQLVLSPGTGFATYQWSTGATGATLAATADGTYSVTVTDATGCTGTTSQTVAIPVNPQVTVSGPAQVCFGQTGQIQASGAYPMYEWSGGQMSTSITASQTGTYTVTVTDNNGCTATAAAGLTVLPQVQPAITGPSAICPGASATLTTGSYSQYSWSTGATTASISSSQSGIFAVTVTDANGCTGTSTHTLSINTPPAPQITVSPYTCNNQLNLTAVGAFTSYSWSNTSTTATAIATSNGPYTVTVTDANGCTGTVSKTISIPANPTVTISGTPEVCFGGSATLFASGTGGPFVSYGWSSLGGNSPSVLAYFSGTYHVTVTDANGCTATDDFLFTIRPGIVPAITGPGLICPGTTATLVVNGNFSQYLWATGATTASIQTGIQGAYTVTVTDAFGCTGQTVHGLVVATPPAPQITVAPYNCNNQLSLSTGVFPTYNWSNGSSTATIAVTANGAYTVTVTDANGCTGTAAKTANIPPNPQVTVSGTTQFCNGQNTALQASGAYPAYHWSSGQNTASITVSQSGSFTVTVTDSNGCTATAATQTIAHPQSVTQLESISCFAQDTGVVVQHLTNQWGCDSMIVSHTALAPQVSLAAAVTSSFNGTSVSCAGAQDGAAKVTALTGTAPYVYHWNTNAATPAIQQLSAGAYQVTVTDANGCTAVSAVALSEPPPVVPTISTVPVACFEPGALQITHIEGGATPYTIEVGTKAATSNGNTLVKFSDLAPGAYPVVVTDANGCTAEQTLTLQAPTGVNASFADSFWIEAGTSIRLRGPKGYDYQSITWGPATGLSCTDCLDVDATVWEETLYTITLQGYGNCKVVGDYLVRVRPRIYAPNVIKPGSNENGVFTFYTGKGDVNIRVLRVFTRWGEMVEEILDFAPNGPVGWAGDFRGTPVNPGVYVYYAEVVMADGSVVLLKGDVTVLR